MKCESKQLIHYLKQLCSTFREDVHACEHHLLYDAQRHKMFVDGRKICCKLWKWAVIHYMKQICSIFHEVVHALYSAFNLERPFLCFVVNNSCFCHKMLNVIAIWLKFGLKVHTSLLDKFGKFKVFLFRYQSYFCLWTRWWVTNRKKMC